MVDIGLTQEQIDSMLAGTAPNPASTQLSAASAQAFADFERDTLGNFPSVINAMTGLDFRFTSVEVASTSAEEISALVGDDVVFSIPFLLGGEQASFVILDAGFAKLISAALTGTELSDEPELTEMERSALCEVISQGRGSYLASLSRALQDAAEPIGDIEITSVEALPNQIAVGTLAASIMMDDSAGHSAHMLHVIPPQLAERVLDGIRAAQAPVAQGKAQEPAVSDGLHRTQANPAAVAQGFSRSGHMETGLPPAPSGRVMEAASAQYAPAVFGQLGAASGSTDVRNLDMLLDVPLQITVELGKTQVPIRQILEYGQGSLITLDKLAGEPIDMLVNGRYFAKAEVVVIDENFGVRITSILSPAERIAQIK